MGKQSLWSTLSIQQRSKIIGAWKDTFVMFCIVFIVGGNVMCHIYDLAGIVSLVFTVLGISSGALAEALDIWGEVLIYWDKDEKKEKENNHLGNWLR